MLTQQFNDQAFDNIGNILLALLSAFFSNLNLLELQEQAPSQAQKLLDVKDLEEVLESSSSEPLVPNFPLGDIPIEDIDLQDLHKMIEDVLIEGKDLENGGQQLMPYYRSYINEIEGIVQEGGPDMHANLSEVVAEMALMGPMVNHQQELMRGEIEYAKDPGLHNTSVLFENGFDTQQELEFVQRSVFLFNAAEIYARENGVSQLEITQNKLNAMEKVAEKVGIPLTDDLKQDILAPEDLQVMQELDHMNAHAATAIASLNSVIADTGSGNVQLINSSVSTAISALDSMIVMNNTGTITIENSHIETAISALNNYIEFNNSGDITIRDSHLETAIAAINEAMVFDNDQDIAIFDQETVTAMASLTTAADEAGLLWAKAETSNASAEATLEVAANGDLKATTETSVQAPGM